MGRSRSRSGLAVAVLFAATASSCAPKVAEGPPKHLVLVTIDTLRADRLGAYGGPSATTPHLDAIARDGAAALDAAAHAPLTRPSHASLLTGRYPAEHGIRDNVAPPLSTKVPTLAEILRRSGFRTGAFVSSFVLSSQSGLERGFEIYSDRFEIATDRAVFLGSVQRRGDEPVAEAVSWLEENEGSRRFLWLHLYDPHYPYEPPEPYASRHASDPYQGEVAWSDELVGRIEDALGRLGLRESTLLVVTSDHGEALGDHGERFHGFFAYESTLRVPLLLRGPGIARGTRLEQAVQSVDLLPTVLDLLGVPLPEGIAVSGRSFAAALSGGAPPEGRPVFAEAMTPKLHYGWSELASVREDGWKYIEAPRPELYDLRSDPLETKNLFTKEPARARGLQEILSRAFEEAPGGAARPAEHPGLAPENLSQLAALGYVGSTGSPVNDPGADPKDKLEEYESITRLLREGVVLLYDDRDPAGAATRFQELRARGLASFEAHYYYGRSLFELRRYREAAAELALAIDRLPAFVSAYIDLADCHTARGDSDAALAALKRGREALPRDPRLPEAEGRLWRRLGKPQEAIAAFAAAVSLAPEDALLKVHLGEAYAAAGDFDRAVASLLEAVKLDPEQASFWNSLGVSLASKQDFTGAAESFSRAASLDPETAEYAQNLERARALVKDSARP